METTGKLPRTEVYRAIDGERAYQDAKWDTTNRRKPTEAYLTYMKSYLDEAFYEISHTAGDTGALDKLRKVVALGVACFEDNGVPLRNISATGKETFTITNGTN